MKRLFRTMKKELPSLVDCVKEQGSHTSRAALDMVGGANQH
jgi:hypothetical protein